MVIRALLAFLFLLTPLQTAFADATVTNTTALRQAVERAAAGETIILAPGRYETTDLKLPRDIILKGQDAVTLYSSSPVAKGLLNPLPGASLRVENIAFEGAASPDENGAGIRHDGDDLTIIHCRFENNENGVLATGSDTGRIAITGSAFIGNGHGDGYSHGIYVVRGERLEITGSKFTGTKIGHHVKSLAASTLIRHSILDDADGKTSYAVDASKGGAVRIESNLIIQSVDSDNYAIFNYDLSRGGAATALEIVGNRIVNRHPNGIFLRNATELQALIEGNEIVNEGRGRLD